VLEDVNKYVKDVFDILNRETNRVRKEMEALDEAAKKLAPDFCAGGLGFEPRPDQHSGS